MHVNVKIVSRLRQQCSKLYNIVVGVLSLAPCYVRKKAGTWQRRPFVISPWKGSVFVGGWLPDHASTPCRCEKIGTKEVLHLFRCYTHTHIYMHIYIYILIYIYISLNPIDVPMLNMTHQIPFTFHWTTTKPEAPYDFQPGGRKNFFKVGLGWDALTGFSMISW